MKTTKIPTTSRLIQGTSKLLQKAKFTKWTAHQPVTKQLSLADDGSIKKTSTAAQLSAGTVTRHECSPKAFVTLLQGIGPNDCLSYGLPRNAQAMRVMTQSNFEVAGRPDDAMPRTADAMAWPDGPGILMVDYDPEDTILTPTELREALYRCCPPLRDAAHVWAASTSSCLTNSKTKQEVRGIRGQRVYVFVADAADIPRAAKVLAKLAWLNGFGYIKVSKAGSLLVRCIVDEAVFQPNRIDYCAPPICEEPLLQRKPKPVLHGDDHLTLDTRVALPDLTTDQETMYGQLVDQAKAMRAAEAAQIRAQYIESRAAEYVAKGLDNDVAVKIVRQALENQVLSADFMLRSEDGDEVTVGDVLSNKALWHGKNFCDPAEPYYHDDSRIARAYLNGPGRPIVRSFAHGGRVYYLSHATVTLRLTPGQRHEYMNHVAAILKERGECYQHAGRLVSITDKHCIEEFSDFAALHLLDRSFRCEVNNKGKWQPTDMPLNNAKYLRGALTAMFPLLHSVITAPIMVPTSGRIISTSGYDVETGIYACIPDSGCHVVTNPTLHEIEAALKALWMYVRLFPFSEPVDQAIMLTAMLTAVMRPLLPTAPGFVFDAPTQGSGKTLLVKVLAAMTGTVPTMSPYPGENHEDEMRKALFAKLLGGSPVIAFDNVTGEFDSPTLAVILTTPHFSDRYLGLSKVGDVPTNTLVLASGNNITLKGDLPRRMPVCRINPNTENPHQRSFDFDPLDMVTAHRQELVAAALTLIAGYRAAKVQQRPGVGSMASFSEWDDCVRQPVCWLYGLQKQGLLPSGSTPSGDVFPQLTDPADAINEAIQEDPNHLQLARLLEAWASDVLYGHRSTSAITVKALIAAVGQICSPQFAPVSGATDPKLPEVIAEIAGSGKSFFVAINTRRLGNYFAANVDTVINGLALRKGPQYQGTWTWWVEDVGGFRGFGGLVSAHAQINNSNIISITTVANQPTKPTKPTTAKAGATHAIAP